MFGNKNNKIKKEIEKKAGTYTFLEGLPENVKDKLRKSADEMNKYYGEDIIHIEDEN